MRAELGVPNSFTPGSTCELPSMVCTSTAEARPPYALHAEDLEAIKASIRSSSSGSLATCRSMSTELLSDPEYLQWRVSTALQPYLLNDYASSIKLTCDFSFADTASMYTREL